MVAQGICRECEEPISPARLKAMPKAAYCVGCQSKREQESPIRRRGVQDGSGVVLVAGEKFEPAEAM